MNRDLGALSRTRALLTDWLSGWHWNGDAADDVVLVASELISNAAEHGESDSVLEIALDTAGLRITVRDYSTDLPRLQPFNPTARRGRGLQMVAAMAQDWGITTLVDGKAVWAHFLHHSTA